MQAAEPLLVLLVLLLKVVLLQHRGHLLLVEGCRVGGLGSRHEGARHRHSRVALLHRLASKARTKTSVEVGNGGRRLLLRAGRRNTEWPAMLSGWLGRIERWSAALHRADKAAAAAIHQCLVVRPGEVYRRRRTSFGIAPLGAAGGGPAPRRQPAGILSLPRRRPVCLRRVVPPAAHSMPSVQPLVLVPAGHRAGLRGAPLLLPIRRPAHCHGAVLRLHADVGS